MDTKPENQGTPLDTLSASLSTELCAAVNNLYIGQLSNAKEAFDTLVQKLELEADSQQPLMDHVCLKLAKDLKGYQGLQDAVWLVNQRSCRADTFSVHLNGALLAEMADEADQAVLDLLPEKAGEIPYKKLVCDVLFLEKQRNEAVKKTDEDLDTIAALARRAKLATPDDQQEQDEELVYCLILCFQRIAFMFRMLGDKELFSIYHKKAMDLCDRRNWDLALKMELQTHLIRALKSSGKSSDVNIYVNNLLDMINKVNELDKIELSCGLKQIREAYNDCSVACSYHMIAEEKLLSVGKKLYDSWRRKYGDEHHEVIFLASQLAYNFKSFGHREEAGQYLAVTENGLKAFPESTRMIMQAKAKALIHVWKIYREDDDLDKAELYCKEEIRVNKKHGISQQYVANALRNLAFIVRDQGRTEEGLKYLQEALDLSKTHRPDLNSFHEKVQNEIQKFVLES